MCILYYVDPYRHVIWWYDRLSSRNGEWRYHEGLSRVYQCIVETCRSIIIGGIISLSGKWSSHVWKWSKKLYDKVHVGETGGTILYHIHTVCICGVYTVYKGCFITPPPETTSHHLYPSMEWWDAVLQKRLALALFVLLLLTLVCCKPTELILGFFCFINFPILLSILRYNPVTPQVLEDSDGFIVVIDVTSFESFEVANTLISKIKRYKVGGGGVEWMGMWGTDYIMCECVLDWAKGIDWFCVSRLYYIILNTLFCVISMICYFYTLPNISQKQSY